MPRRKQRKIKLWWIMNAELGGKLIEYGGHLTRKAAINRFMLNDTVYTWDDYKYRGYTCAAVDEWK